MLVPMKIDLLFAIAGLALSAAKHLVRRRFCV